MATKTETTLDYTVIPGEGTLKTGKKVRGFYVRTPTGQYANSFLHRTRESAEQHAALCNAFFGTRDA